MIWWRAFYEVARKEALQHVRTKRLLVLGIILALSLIFVTIIVPIAFFGLDEGGFPDDGVALENLAFLFFLNAPVIGGLFIIQILAVVLTADGVSSEWQNRSIFLLLSKPVPRSAFVMGKYVGAMVPLTVLLVGLFSLDYLLLQGLLPGSPSGADVGRFFGAQGLIIAGILAFGAMGLFFSSLMRSSLPSLVLSLVFAFVVFPIANSIGDFTLIADQIDGAGQEIDESSWKYDWSHYFSPASALNKAPGVVSNTDQAFAFNFLFPQFPPNETALAVVASLGFAALFVMLSLLTVMRRDFE